MDVCWYLDIEACFDGLVELSFRPFSGQDRADKIPVFMGHIKPFRYERVCGAGNRVICLFMGYPVS